MAVDTVTVTDTFQQIATGAVALTVKVKGTRSLLINETATDVDAFEVNPEVGEQFLQNEAKATFVRSDGEDWVLHLDGTL